MIGSPAMSYLLKAPTPACLLGKMGQAVFSFAHLAPGSLSHCVEISICRWIMFFIQTSKYIDFIILNMMVKWIIMTNWTHMNEVGVCMYVYDKWATPSWMTCRALPSGWHVLGTPVLAGSGKKDSSWFVALVSM